MRLLRSNLTRIIRPFRGYLKNSLVNEVDSYIYSKTVGGNTKVEIDNGLTMYLNPSDYVVSRRIWREGSFQPNVRDFINREVRQGDHTIDVGANIGYFTVLMGDIVGSSGNVLSFEPADNNVQILNKNIKENNLSGVVNVRSEAASNQNGFAKLSLANFNKGSHSIAVQEGSEEVIKVPTVKIDDVISDEIDLVKVDVEGAEDKVLTGMEQILSEYAPTVILEYNPMLWEREPEDVVDQLIDANLAPYKLVSGGKVNKIRYDDVLDHSFNGDLVFK